MSQIQTEDVIIPADHEFQPGMPAIPESVRGLVLFAHGTGSSRFSTRNLQVAVKPHRWPPTGSAVIRARQGDCRIGTLPRPAAGLTPEAVHTDRNHARY